MKKTLTLSALVLITMVSSTANAEVSILSKVGGTSAIAEFSNIENVPPFGNVRTSVSIFVSANTVLEPPQENGPIDDPLLAVVIDRSVVGTGVNLLSGIGHTSTFSFTVDKDFTTASLQGDVGIFDESTFTSFLATINMTWTGTGAEVTEQTREVQKNGSIILRARFKGTFRDGVATGSLQGRGLEFTPQPSISAQLQNNTSGFLVVLSNAN